MREKRRLSERTSITDRNFECRNCCKIERKERHENEKKRTIMAKPKKENG